MRELSKSSATQTLPMQSGIALLGILRFLKAWLRDAYWGISRPRDTQLPFLDVLRTIAIILVVNHHFGASYEAQFGQNAFTRAAITRSGWAGVDLFFVLSGFLIGGQLWSELSRSGTISVRAFILRRGLRIWPLYYSVLLAILIADHVHWRNYGPAWADSLFLSDYVFGGVVPGGWSLCIEEQFYIAAPILLLAFAAVKMKQCTRLMILWGLFLLLPLIRAFEWRSLTGSIGSHRNTAAFDILYYNFHTHCDGLIIGVIIAAFKQNCSGRQDRAWKRPATTIFAGLLFILLRRLHPEIFDFTGLALFCGALVWWGFSSNSKLFQSRMFFTVSRLSFGMYLNHQLLLIPVIGLVIPFVGHFTSRKSAQLLLGLLALITSSILVASLSYLFIEHPFLKLRSALVRRRSIDETA